MLTHGVKVYFEDNHVIVAYKPAGVLSQADGSNSPDMLSILKEYLKVKYNKPGNVFLGLIHRLDRNVEGIMVFARTSKAASRLSEQVRNRKVSKKYRAVINGCPQKLSDKIENYCLKDSKSNTTKVYDYKPSLGEAKLSSLVYNVIGKNKLDGHDISLVEVTLLTGRSHQIRAQFSHLGHALLGDNKYGDKLYRGSVCLQSYLIGFNHPVTGEYSEYTLPIIDDKPWNLFGGV